MEVFAFFVNIVFINQYLGGLILRHLNFPAKDLLSCLGDVTDGDASGKHENIYIIGPGSRVSRKSDHFTGTFRSVYFAALNKS